MLSGMELHLHMSVGVLVHPRHGADAVSRTFQVIAERAFLTKVVFEKFMLKLQWASCLYII
jgi:hypothetical protein